jgi:hypothetical protein
MESRAFEATTLHAQERSTHKPYFALIRARKRFACMILLVSLVTSFGGNELLQAIKAASFELGGQRKIQSMEAEPTTPPIPAPVLKADAKALLLHIGKSGGSSLRCILKNKNKMRESRCTQQKIEVNEWIQPQCNQIAKHTVRVDHLVSRLDTL